VTTHATREFLPVLRELERRLPVPIPTRVRILRELEFDLEQLRTRFVAVGLSSEEARARALEALMPGTVALQQLGDLHAPFYRRVTHQLRDDRLRLLERTALAVATAAVLVVEGLLLAGSGAFRVAPHLLWPVLSVGALLFAVVVHNGFRVWIKSDHSPSQTGAAAVLGLAGATLCAGLTGAFIDTHATFGILALSPELAGTLVPRWLMRNAALLALSILIALAGALGWFVMTQWVASVSAAYRDVLGLGPSNPSTGAEHHE
jgi:hypothetical protein